MGTGTVLVSGVRPLHSLQVSPQTQGSEMVEGHIDHWGNQNAPNLLTDHGEEEETGLPGETRSREMKVRGRDPGLRRTTEGGESW